MGNFYHNTEVLATNRGNLILVRRPSENESRFFVAEAMDLAHREISFLTTLHIPSPVSVKKNIMKDLW